MKAKQANGGYHFLAADVVAESTRALQDLCLTLCGACDDWEYYGSVADGREFAIAHRGRMHPERVDRGQKARRQAAKAAPKAVASFGDSDL